MPSNFLSRLVKSPPPSRERSESSLPSTPTSIRRRSPSTPNPTPSSVPQPPSPPPPLPVLPSNILSSVNSGPKIVVDADTASLHSKPSSVLNVVVVPPSPHRPRISLSTYSSEQDLRFPSDHRQACSNSPEKPHTLNITPRIRTISAPSPRHSPLEESPMTPKLDKDKSSSPSRSQPPSPSGFANLKLRLQKSTSNLSLSPPDARRKPSNKSLKRPPPPITVPSPSVVAKATSSTPSLPNSSAVVCSPDKVHPSDEPMSKSQSAPLQTIDTNGGTLQAPKRDPDNVSIASSASQGQNKEKKGAWRSNSRQSSGLAGAIAASGLAMANPTMSQSQINASMVQVTRNPNPSQTSISQPPTHVKSRSTDLATSPKTKGLPLQPPSRHRMAISTASDNGSENYLEGPEYLELDPDSGLDDDDSGSGSESELDLGIPVTGFAVASNKRNADFHELFPNIPDGDYLIEDYGCALQREILIQGRLYVSENHVCFHANIFGWITDLSIPVYDITCLEKKMTAFVIPNGIHISTQHAKYTFASFLSRDTTFDVIHNVWRQARPDDIISILSSARASLEGASSEQVGKVDNIPKAVNKVTQCGCGRNSDHYPEVALEVILPGTPDRIHNLIFASGFIKDFLAVEQKLTDIQMSDWVPIEPGSKLLARNMSYIKPLNAGLGPKQTKCEIRDETVYADPEDYLTMLTTTRTPDVPSGSVFSVKTRTCIMWASAITTKVVITTQVEWTGRSFIKGIIEKSAIEGQKVYHADLEKAMRAYIQEHQSEFVPAGIDPLAIELAESTTNAASRDSESAGAIEQRLSVEEERRQREHERNRRGLQWAWDTFDGAYQVAKRSTKGALELVKDAWDQSTTTTILWFVIVILVFSNLWTLVRMGRREEIGRRKELMRVEERDRWVQGVVGALRDELAAKSHVAGDALPPAGSSSLHNEIANLKHALDTIEERVMHLRQSLDDAERTTDPQVTLD